MRPPQPTISEASDRLARTVALGDSVSRVRFCTGARLEALERLDIHTVWDLLHHTPRRYMDFSVVTTIAQAAIGDEVTIIATVDRVNLKRPRPNLSIVEVHVVDDTGVMRISFFKQPWLAEQIRRGDVLALSGKVTFNYGFKQMSSPFHELVGREGEDTTHGRILPVHGLVEGITAAWMRRIASAALEDYGDFCDFMPAALVARHRLMAEPRALRAAHFPQSPQEMVASRRRLAYDELLCLQLALRGRHHLGSTVPVGVSHEGGDHLERLREGMPFSLTGDQEAAFAEIRRDMESARPMNRLLLGDVGTGKTAVAALAMALCSDSGTQAAVMAPTSVLATQYAVKLGPLLDGAGIRWCLITGATATDERARLTAAISAGEITVVFGTSAILSEDVAFHDLTLAVVDEQHRFGVNQRSALKRKGTFPDVLTMTATPIPRTLALSVYGDVDVSTMEERPHPGAGSTTTIVSPGTLHRAWAAVREAVEAGNQAYVVCPLVDDDDEGNSLEMEGEEGQKLASAASTARELSCSILPDLRIATLTGAMAAAQKDAVMDRFREGDLDVLVCTTVIEVGVDVPNATVLVVMDADRFGLATLHQLRGRVGRGTVAGRVFLETSAKRGTPARTRLSALEKTTSGLELAELDLELRHEGDVLGYRQSGGVTLRYVDFTLDADLVEAAHGDAMALLERDPGLTGPLHGPLALEVRRRFGLYFEQGGGA